MPPVLFEGNPIQRVSYTKFLGLCVDENLNWSYRINELCKKIIENMWCNV